MEMIKVIRSIGIYFVILKSAQNFLQSIVTGFKTHYIGKTLRTKNQLSDHDLWQQSRHIKNPYLRMINLSVSSDTEPS